MTWRCIPTADGSVTLAHPGHGETCHSVAGAWQQARERYAHGCRLADRAREIAASGRDELCLLDVGTGLGLNLAAALAALDKSGVRLRAVSLELDPRVIETTLALPVSASCDTWERWHAPVREALSHALCDPRSRRDGVALADGTLRLVLGDARETLRMLSAERCFDAVFLDGFSPRVDPALWEPAFLARVARSMAPASWLSTYSAAVSVRAGLIAAGLRVGPGLRVGTKAAGTIASPDQEPAPFPARLARRLAARAAALSGR